MREKVKCGRRRDDSPLVFRLSFLPHLIHSPIFNPHSIFNPQFKHIQETLLMLNRLNLLRRHLPLSLSSSRPTVPSVCSLASSPLPAMTSAAANFTNPIHTAACLIIGDEVLGGKVREILSNEILPYERIELTSESLDDRYQLPVPGQVLLRSRHPTEKGRGHSR